jgi:hypothetical protein
MLHKVGIYIEQHQQEHGIDEIQMYEVIKHDICGFRAEHQQVVEDIVYAL